MTDIDGKGLADWGSWIVGGLTFLGTALLAYVIKPIAARSLQNADQIAAVKGEQGSRFDELRREQEMRLAQLREEHAVRIDDLRMKQVETETTLKIYVESQAKIQQSLGRIEGKVSEVLGTQTSQAGALSRLEAEVGEIRRLHMKAGA